MALNVDEPTVAPGSQQQTTQQQAQTQQPTQQQNQQSFQQKTSVRSLNSLLSRPLGRSEVSETLAAIVKSFNDILSEIQESDLGFKLLVIDNKQSLTALSAITLCYRKSVGGKEYVAIYTMLVSGGTKLNNRNIRIGDQNVEIVTTPGDVADSELRKYVMNTVQELYDRSTRVIECSSNVIHDEVDVNNKSQLRAILTNASRACYAGLVTEKVISEVPFNAKLIGSNDSLVAHVDMNPQPINNTSGLPIRNDMQIELRAVTQQASQSQPEQVIGLTQVNGFVDLVYVPPQMQANQPMVWGQQNNVAPQRYCPRFVITNFTSQLDATTMELQLLALASSQILVENIGGAPQWMNTFRPRSVSKGEIDKRDIGAVGLEVNFSGTDKNAYGIIDTKSNTFSNQDLYKLIGMSFYQNLIYSIDVEESGDLSYLNMPLAYAASATGELYSKAHAYITNAANQLTNNNFSRCWQAVTGGNVNERYFLSDENRIFTGYYIDKDQVKRDLRDIDYLAILNLMGKNNAVQYIKDWSDTYDRAEVPVEIRLEKRRRILESLLSNNLHIKGYARRITMSPLFMQALTMSCKESGLIFRPSNLNIDYNTNGQHGIANAFNMGVAPNASGLFSFGNSNQGVQSGINYNNGFTGFGRNW